MGKESKQIHLFKVWMPVCIDAQLIVTRWLEYLEALNTTKNSLTNSLIILMEPLVSISVQTIYSVTLFSDQIKTFT